MERDYREKKNKEKRSPSALLFSFLFFLYQREKKTFFFLVSHTIPKPKHQHLQRNPRLSPRSCLFGTEYREVCTVYPSPHDSRIREGQTLLFSFFFFFFCTRPLSRRYERLLFFPPPLQKNTNNKSFFPRRRRRPQHHPSHHLCPCPIPFAPPLHCVLLNNSKKTRQTILKNTQSRENDFYNLSKITRPPISEAKLRLSMMM